MQVKDSKPEPKPEYIRKFSKLVDMLPAVGVDDGNRSNCLTSAS